MKHDTGAVTKLEVTQADKGLVPFIWAMVEDGEIERAEQAAARHRLSHSLPGDGMREALDIIDKFFEPWGAWKTVWWEGEVSDDVAFSADNALRHVANILRRAALGETP